MCAEWDRLCWRHSRWTLEATLQYIYGKSRSRDVEEMIASTTALTVATQLVFSHQRNWLVFPHKILWVPIPGSRETAPILFQIHVLWNCSKSHHDLRGQGLGAVPHSEGLNRSPMHLSMLYYFPHYEKPMTRCLDIDGNMGIFSFALFSEYFVIPDQCLSV